MSIFVQNAPSAIALAVKTSGVWVAWGTGDPSWDSVPVAEPSATTSLIAEVGRRLASMTEFVVPDSAGAISVPQGNFSISSTPTSSLYVRCNFANDDAVGLSIRESAAFIGTKVKPSVPVGTDYFTPDQLDSFGVMLILSRFAKIERTSAFSASLEFVVNL